MTDRFTPDQRARIKQAARDLLAAKAAGKKCDPLGVEWAENILRANPADPSVHEPRVTDLPTVPHYIVELICDYGDARENKDSSRGRRLSNAVGELCKWCSAAVVAERERAARVSQATAQRVPARSETGPFAYTGAQLLASQPANDELPEPVAHRVRGFIRGVPQPWRLYGPICPSRYLAEGADVEAQALYTADQMREAIAAERGRGAKPPKWWTCPTHGDARSNAWGCPECVREMRSELASHAPLIADVLVSPRPGDLLAWGSQAVLDVAAERRRQIAVEGYDTAHDDSHVNDEIAALACFYVMPPGAREWCAESTGYGDTLGEAILPENWEAREDDRRRELVKAGALILAEIERLDRANGIGEAAAQER